MNRGEMRFYISTLLMLDFAVVLVSGIALYLAPSGPATVWGVDKELWESVHTVAGLVMTILVAIHLYLNWIMYKNEAKMALK